MQQEFNLIVSAPDEETARQSILEWYADKCNVTILSAKHVPEWEGYQVFFSFDID